jgi:nicotinamide-nucleotide amidase
MIAAILAVGSELLGTDRLDTNSLRLAGVLERHGAELVGKEVVGDDSGRIAAALGRLAGECDLVLVTGGLGPTADDLTREGAAEAFGLELALDETVLGEIEARFRSFGRAMPAVNRRQALVPAGAEVLPNRRGTAPGLRLAAGGATLFLFPGVPHELDGLVAATLEPWLAERGGGGGIETGVLKVACLPESEVEERIAPAYGEFGREAISVLARPGEIELRFRAAGTPAERRARLESIAARLRALVGRAVFTGEAEETLESVAGALLAAGGRTLATAESCTGGLVAERLTRVAGSSGWFVGGVVAYSNELKCRLLGVAEELVAEHGAVSEPVARAMAEGARTRLGADLAIAITGIAGPGGGTADKPVGTVHHALAGPRAGAGGGPGAAGGAGIETGHRLVRLPGDRAMVRALSAQLALEMVRRRLLALGGAAAAPAEPGARGGAVAEAGGRGPTRALRARVRGRRPRLGGGAPARFTRAGRGAGTAPL